MIQIFWLEIYNLAAEVQYFATHGNYASVTVKTNADTDGKDAQGIDCFKYEI